ncbi:MAG: hypothetical protein ACR2NY_04190 [Alphaproteobacteria bacterium]
MAKKIKKTSSKKNHWCHLICSKRTIITVLATILGLLIIKWTICGISSLIHGKRSYSIADKAEYKAEKMGRHMRLSDSEVTAVEAAILKYFSGKQQARETWMNDMEAILPARAYKKFERKMKRRKKR